MLEQPILFCGASVRLRCDGRCDKAFGINGRPRRHLSANEDDYVYRSDAEVGVAPGPGETVGLSEGDDLKPSAVPLTDAARMNKWCARECERSVLATADEAPPDLSHPSPNIPEAARV